MAHCRAEFTIQPFEEGHPGPHVVAAVAAARSCGFDPDMGPFGTSITGEASAVLSGLRRVVDDSLAAGASRISVQLTVLAE
ncbi:MAG: hypothetical protein GY720_05430 [bacterium]|nr:hypothetical protein [bacterium]